MAIEPVQLKTSSADTVRKRRMAPVDGGVLVKTFAAVAGAPTLQPGTAVGIDSTSKKFVPWTSGGAAAGTDLIKGIVWPNPIPTHATNDVLGNVMVAGEIHPDDILVGPLSVGQEAALVTALAAQAQALRDMGLWMNPLAKGA